MKNHFRFINKFIYPLGLFVMLSGFSYKVNANGVTNKSDAQISNSNVQNKDIKKIKSVDKGSNKQFIIPEDQSNILKNIRMNFKYEPVYQTRNMEFLINANYNEDINYRILLHSKRDNAWRDITSGYTCNRKGNELFKVNLFKVLPGEYEIVVFAKKSLSQGEKELNIGEYNIKYDDYKLQPFECKTNGNISLESSINKKAPVYEGSFQDITMKTNGYHGMVQYSVWIYSSLNKKWTSLTSGYTDEISSDNSYKISTSKLNAGNYKVSVRVKKAWEKGIHNDGLGDYDDKQEFSFSVITKYKPIKPDIVTAPNISSVYVGNDGEGNRIRIRKGPSTNTQTIGYIYGSTQGIKILGKKDNFYYVEARDYDTLNLVKGYIRCDYVKQVTPNKNYSIVVDISEQKIYVYNKNKLIHKFICSTGIDSTPTPTGVYLVGDRGESFGQEKGYICYNFIRINNNYLFHSVIHYLDGSIIQHEYNKLGHKASHGCIRLKDQDVKWMYTNIPRGTLVVIQQ